CVFFFFFSSRRRHTRFSRDWSSDVCSSDLIRCPVRLVVGTVGRGSGVSPQEVATLAGLLRSFAVDTVPGAGHFVYEERPAAVVAAVQRLHSGDGLGEGRLPQIGGRYYTSPP